MGAEGLEEAHERRRGGDTPRPFSSDELFRYGCLLGAKWMVRDAVECMSHNVSRANGWMSSWSIVLVR